MLHEHFPVRSRVQSPSFSVRLATSFCRPFGRQLGLCLAGTVGLGLFSACDGNIGRAFDPRLDPPGGGGGGGGSPGVIQAAVAGGISRDGRPSVVEAFPTGGGWAPTVPIVVVFDESLNTTTVLPSTPTGTDAGVFVRDQTTMTVVPASYGFLAGNRVVVIRPSLPLQGVAMTQYEVVVDPEVRDADGIRVGGTEPMVVATFSPDVDTAEVDARLVTTVPIDNADDALTSDSVFAFFDRPAIPMSVNMTTFQVSPAGGSPLMKAPEFTFQTMGVDDTRVAALIPDTPFVAGGDVDIDLTRDVRFAMEGRLDVSAASPTSGFTVNGLEAPVTVELHSSSAGFPEKINAGNAGMVMMRVELPSSVLNNDRVFVRIYGSDATTASTVDVDFVEGSVTVPMDGATEVIVVLNNMLGDAQSRVFDDGELRFAARIERRSMVSGYTLGDADLNPALDFTVPEIVLVGPPTSGEGEVYAFDQDRFVLHGRASEELAAAELVANNLTVPMFASAENGRFMMNPMPVAGRETSFTLLITDVAGNMAVAPFAGIAVQRGVVSGDVSIGGELSVSVFDDETLLPVGGAMVFIDPMEPTVPSNSSRRVAVTGGDGFAIQGGLPSPRHTITVVAPGYDLVTLYDTPASQVSLPLRPTAESPSQISGTLAFVPMQPANTTALIGTGVFEDHALLAVQNTNANLTMIPTTNVRPNRLAVVGAVGGIFEPTTARAFTAIGCGLCGLTGMTPTPAPTPVGPGDDLGVQIGVIPEASIPGLAIETASLIPLNFGQAGGPGYRKSFGSVRASVDAIGRHSWTDTHRRGARPMAPDRSSR